MTKIEALELELAAYKMVEGTELDWWSVVRIVDWDDHKYISIVSCPNLDAPKENYELALGIVEGEPVFKGDILYDQNGTKLTAGVSVYGGGELSWNPPKTEPKTVMVEMLVEDAEFLAHPAYPVVNQQRAAEACRKALEEKPYGHGQINSIEVDSAGKSLTEIRKLNEVRK